jgi:hypothetical protein
MALLDIVDSTTDGGGCSVQAVGGEKEEKRGAR